MRGGGGGNERRREKDNQLAGDTKAHIHDLISLFSMQKRNERPTAEKSNISKGKRGW